jgi:hypothetical protein
VDGGQSHTAEICRLHIAPMRTRPEISTLDNKACLHYYWGLTEAAILEKSRRAHSAPIIAHIEILKLNALHMHVWNIRLSPIIVYHIRRNWGLSTFPFPAVTAKTAIAQHTPITRSEGRSREDVICHTGCNRSGQLDTIRILYYAMGSCYNMGQRGTKIRYDG